MFCGNYGLCVHVQGVLCYFDQLPFGSFIGFKLVLPGACLVLCLLLVALVVVVASGVFSRLAPLRVLVRLA